MREWLLRAASAADCEAASALLAAASLPGLAPGAQFGPNYAIAVDGSGRMVAIAACCAA